MIMRLLTLSTTIILLLLLSLNNCFAAAIRSIAIEYSFVPPIDRTIESFIVYKEGIQVCTTTNTTGDPINCDFETLPGTYNFTMQAKYTDGTLSPTSETYPFTIEADQGLAVPVIIRLYINK